jgi:hypothetical protein
MSLFKHKESSIFCVWDFKSEQVLESHNCFVDENIIAYENIANIEVHSKKKTTSTNNHAVNLSSASSLSLLQPSFISEKCLHQLHCCFNFAITVIKFCQHAFFIFFCFRESIYLFTLSVWTYKFRLISFKWVVWFRWAQFIKLFSLSCITLQSLQSLSCWQVWHTHFICVCCNSYWWHCQTDHI